MSTEKEEAKKHLIKTAMKFVGWLAFTVLLLWFYRSLKS